MDRPVVTELIQNDFNVKRLKKELDKILDKDSRKQMFLDYFELEKTLGGKGASMKTAQLIYEGVKK